MSKELTMKALHGYGDIRKGDKAEFVSISHGIFSGYENAYVTTKNPRSVGYATRWLEQEFLKAEYEKLGAFEYELKKAGKLHMSKYIRKQRGTNDYVRRSQSQSYENDLMNNIDPDNERTCRSCGGRGCSWCGGCGEVSRKRGF